jgi:hypothetical protein
MQVVVNQTRCHHTTTATFCSGGLPPLKQILGFAYIDKLASYNSQTRICDDPTTWVNRDQPIDMGDQEITMLGLSLELVL